jgi:hypothetical protein
MLVYITTIHYFMIRTQISLPKTLAQRIALEALKANKPIARVICDLLEAGFRQRSGETAQEAVRSLMAIGQQLKAHGPADLSSKIDHYLYDQD